MKQMHFDLSRVLQVTDTIFHGPFIIAVCEKRRQFFRDLIVGHAGGDISRQGFDSISVMLFNLGVSLIYLCV